MLVIFTTGMWPDGRLFLIFDTPSQEGVRRVCWTPGKAEERLLRRLLYVLAEENITWSALTSPDSL
jgi:hypothetical protein